MKRQIRNNVFETNSSSTHAVTILTDAEYEQYRKGDLLVSRYGRLTPKEELEKEAKEYAEKEMLHYDKPENSWLRDTYTREELYDSCFHEYMWPYEDDCMEVEHDSRVIDSIVVHALSVYGYDG